MKQKLRGVRARVSSKFALLAVVLLMLIGATVGLGGYTLHKQHQQKAQEAASPQLRQAKAEQLPSAAVDKVDYYVQLAAAYSSVGNYQQAIKTYLLADKYITDRTVDAPVSVNTALYYNYKAEGNKKQARIYLDREIQRIKADPENQRIVTSLTKEEQAL